MLTSPDISELTLESGTLALWNEFLEGWFDGGSHAVGLNPAIPFPEAVLRYQQSALPQPLGQRVGISLVWVRPGDVTKRWEVVRVPRENFRNGDPYDNCQDYRGRRQARQQVAYARAGWMFWIRAEAPAGAGANAAASCRQAAELLFGVLSNTNATHGLWQKGILKLEPQTPALVSEGSGSRPADLAYALRLVACAGILRYPVLSQLTGI
jgi:hypothetical protein